MKEENGDDRMVFWIGVFLLAFLLIGSFVLIGTKLGFLDDPGGCPDPIVGKPKVGCYGYEGKDMMPNHKFVNDMGGEE